MLNACSFVTVHDDKYSDVKLRAAPESTQNVGAGSKV